MYYKLVLKFDNGRISETTFFQKSYSLVLKYVNSYVQDCSNLEKIVNGSSLVSFSLNPLIFNEL